MTTYNTKMLLGAIAIGLLTSGAMAAEQAVYGSELMTNQERIEQRAKMNAAKTSQAREQVRLEHHEKMQMRAKERGVTLPENPPVPGAGMGPQNGGMGAGMGAGAGMGSGGGMGRGR